ncbi:gamma-glutamylcyclotransferase family protein [Paenibacillus darwinianus]|uniref:gamma-glutamylcyclotransferase family protein n=2 Tax=Paenibacillus darwinianus TaxID=1380763 RepID=UPI0009DCC21D|nr:gamma-glutamylcyclotransferase family protein [Paenibacillus darwinianus]
MQTERYRVFIYGSLLPGMSNHIVVSDYIEAVVPGRIEGRLVDCGAYPALIRSAKANGRSVRGLWIEVGRAGLAAMDALEQFGGIEETNDYERVWAQDLDRPERNGTRAEIAGAGNYREHDGRDPIILPARFPPPISSNGLKGTMQASGLGPIKDRSKRGERYANRTLSCIYIWLAASRHVQPHRRVRLYRSRGAGED